MFSFRRYSVSSCMDFSQSTCSVMSLMVARIAGLDFSLITLLLVDTHIVFPSLVTHIPQSRLPMSASRSCGSNTFRKSSLNSLSKSWTTSIPATSSGSVKSNISTKALFTNRMIPSCTSTTPSATDSVRLR